MVDLTPDDVALSIAPKDPATGAVDVQEAATFRGWLGEGEGGPDAIRLYLSPYGETWLELDGADVLHRIPGSQSGDNSSFIWVKADAKVVKCRLDGARYFADKILDQSEDDIGSRYPRYP